MKRRDVTILNDLEKFRVMSRDHIASLYFGDTRQPVTNANFVLKRLVREGYIKAHTAYRPYVYTLQNSIIKENSRKIRHFLGIVDCYRLFREEYEFHEFSVEPKYQKGFMEPDALMRLEDGCAFFIEFQRKVYSRNELREKLRRYRNYRNSKLWEGDFKEFPSIFFVSYFEIGNWPEGFTDLTILQKRMPATKARYEKVTL